MNGPEKRRAPTAGRSEPQRRKSREGDVSSLQRHQDRIEDPQQAALFGVPRARNHIDRRDGSLVRDPETSMAAAASVSLKSVTRLQRAILGTLTLARQPLSDEQIIQRLSWMGASESGIRSRRAELLRAGLIVVADSNGVSKYGHTARRYVVVAQRGAA